MNYKLSVMCSNLYTICKTLFSQRDDKVVLIGGWMGTKFADNSRFLYQYLSEHKEDVGLDHVIWVTRSEEVKKNLSSMGYEVFLCGTKESKYWHLKAGYHIVCDAIYPLNHLLPDIDTQYSWGAKKIQLWHGNGIKAVGDAVRKEKPSVFKKTVKSMKSLYAFTLPGGWAPGKYKLLSKSPMDADLFNKKFGTHKTDMIEATYPRVKKVCRYPDNEIEVIGELKKFKKVILYLPTFRKNMDSYTHPLECEGLRYWLSDNNMLWIEKPHTAATTTGVPDEYKTENTMFLQSNFDINVLNPIVDLIITDYSSVMLDALAFDKPVVYYTPDFDYYMSKDVGLLMDFDDVRVGPRIDDVEQLKDAIEMTLKTFSIDEKYLKIRNMFWWHLDMPYREIWQQIIDSFSLKEKERSTEMKKVIGYTTGVYDMFHIGHLNVIRRAKERCDYLIVGVSTDELVQHDKGKTPVIPYEERAAIVAALKYVDEVVPQPDKNKLGAWEKYHFDKMFVGSDWQGTPQWQKFEEQFAPLGVEIVYLPHTDGISSTELTSFIKNTLEEHPEIIGGGTGN